MFGPPTAAWSLVAKRRGQVVEPVRIGRRRRRRCRRRSRRSRPRQPDVARAAQSPRFGVRISRSRAICAAIVGGVVGRAVVDDDHLVVGVVERREPVEALARSCARRCSVQTTTETRGQSRSRRERHVRERLARPLRARASGGGRASVRPNSQSSTSRRRGTTRPSRRRRTRRRTRRRRRRGPASRAPSACRSSPLRSAVEPDLAHQQRPVAGEVLQPREVRLEARSLRLEVDVEADEVEERQLQVLGRRVVDVGDEPVRDPRP